MPRLAVLGHPVAHSRSPAMQNAALAELGLGGEWSYEAIDVAPDGFEARVRAMPGEGFVGANVTVPHKGAALASPTTLSRDGAGDRRRQHARASPSGRDPGRQHRRRRPARCAARLAGAASGRWCSAPAAPRGRSSGRCCGRAPRSRSGTGPRLRAAAALRGAGRRAGRRARPGRLRADRQLDRGRPARRGPLRASCRSRPTASLRARRRRHGLRRARRARCSRPPRPPARPPSTASRSWSSRARSRCEIWTGRERAARRHARRRPRLSQCARRRRSTAV